MFLTHGIHAWIVENSSFHYMPEKLWISENRFGRCSEKYRHNIDLKSSKNKYRSKINLKINKISPRCTPLNNFERPCKIWSNLTGFARYNARTQTRIGYFIRLCILQEIKMQESIILWVSNMHSYYMYSAVLRDFGKDRMLVWRQVFCLFALRREDSRSLHLASW